MASLNTKREWLASVGAVVGLVMAATSANAQNVKISAFPAATTLTGSEVVAGVQGGANVKISGTQLTTLATGGTFTSLVCGGVDDTAAIQAALNTGVNVQLAPGICVISSPLLVESYNNNGQTLRGSGSWGAPGTYNSTTPGPGSTSIKPTSAMNGKAIFTIDGTPISGGGVGLSYIQGFGMENMVIDMTNMSDVSGSIAIDQIQAFDIHYDHVRVINYGNNKLSWQFLAGSYTTLLSHVQGGILNFQGSSFTNENTTVTLLNSDIVGFSHDYFEGVTFVGGAIQRAYSSAVPVVYLAPGTTPQGYPTNTTGLYAGVLSQLIDSQNFTTTGTDFEYSGGFTPTAGCSTGQYNDGTHGCLTFVPVIEVQSTAVNTSFINPSFSGVYLLDLSSSTTTLGANAGGGAALDLFNVSTWFNGFQTSIINGNVLTGYSDRETTQTFGLNASTGVGTFQGLNLQPATDADGVWRVKSQGGTILFDLATSSGGALNLENGAGLNGYSDTGSTLTYSLATSTGLLKLYASGSATITLTGANGTIVATGGINSTPIGQSTAAAITGTTVTGSTLVSTVATGTAPLTVTSTTNIANLNASSLNGATFASPGAIGSTSSAAGTFTTVKATNLQNGTLGHTWVSSTAPTSTSGGTMGMVNGSFAFNYTPTSGGSSFVVAMPAAANGWTCQGNDLTTKSASMAFVQQSASATNSVTMSAYTTAMLAGTFGSSDTVQVICVAY